MSKPPRPDGEDGFLVEVLAPHFPPGRVESLIRTWVPVALGAALSWLSLWVGRRWGITWIPERPSSTFTIVMTAVTTAVYYAGVRAIEQRWPRVGRWLVALNLVRARPVYAQPTETVVVHTPGGVARIREG